MTCLTRLDLRASLDLWLVLSGCNPSKRLITHLWPLSSVLLSIGRIVSSVSWVTRSERGRWMSGSSNLQLIIDLRADFLCFFLGRPRPCWRFWGKATMSWVEWGGSSGSFEGECGCHLSKFFFWGGRRKGVSGLISMPQVLMAANVDQIGYYGRAHGGVISSSNLHAQSIDEVE